MYLRPVTSRNFVAIHCDHLILAKRSKPYREARHVKKLQVFLRLLCNPGHIGAACGEGEALFNSNNSRDNVGFVIVLGTAVP